MEYWETEFKNERQQRVSVLENEGQVLLTLEPGARKFVESKSPSTSYAPWFRITFLANGKVQLEENRAWRWPGSADKLMMTIINVDGADSETFYVGAGEPIRCYKGIPRFVAIDVNDTTWNTVAKLEIKLVEHAEQNGDYVTHKKVLEQVRTPRTASEIKAIKERILEDATKRKKLELKIAFARRER